jgi:hypothetical protein
MNESQLIENTTTMPITIDNLPQQLNILCVQRIKGFYRFKELNNEHLMMEWQPFKSTMARLNKGIKHTSQSGIALLVSQLTIYLNNEQEHIYQQR